MTKDQCYLLGYIVKTHGTKGQVVFHLDVDQPSDYDEMDSVFLEMKGELLPYFIDSINLQKASRAIVQLEEIDTMEKGQALVGTALYMPLDTLDELGDGQFYYHEIQGFEIVDKTMGVIGMVGEVYSVATQNLISFDYQGNEALIPIVDNIVTSADREKKQVFVDLPEGLLEVYLSGNTQDPDDKDGDDEN